MFFEEYNQIVIKVIINRLKKPRLCIVSTYGSGMKAKILVAVSTVGLKYEFKSRDLTFWTDSRYLNWSGINDAGKRTSFKKKGVNAKTPKKNDSQKGIRPILKDTKITIYIANRLVMS